ncbi:MAG: toll/interleukin-1 receptor domain-containing protein, partial [Victivallaceae bacterium]
MGNKEEISPKVFMSYSHDSKEHKAWVLKLSSHLRSHGVDVILDQWNVKLGDDLPLFMENGLTESSYIICVCSENYTKKANN